MMMDKLTGNFPMRRPSLSEGFREATVPDVGRNHQANSARLSAAEKSELWDCLYLTHPEIDELLQFVKKEASQPFIYPMFVFAAHTGASQASIRNAKPRDSDQQRKHRDRNSDATIIAERDGDALLLRVLHDNQICHGAEHSEVTGKGARHG